MLSASFLKFTVTANADGQIFKDLEETKKRTSKG